MPKLTPHPKDNGVEHIWLVIGTADDGLDIGDITTKSRHFLKQFQKGAA